MHASTGTCSSKRKGKFFTLLAIVINVPFPLNPSSEAAPCLTKHVALEISLTCMPEHILKYLTIHKQHIFDFTGDPCMIGAGTNSAETASNE